MEAGKRSNAVRWYAKIDKDFRTGLVGFLEEESQRNTSVSLVH